jgi:hypothetical protein
LPDPTPPSGIRAVIGGRTYELDHTLRYEGVRPGLDPSTGEPMEVFCWTLRLPEPFPLPLGAEKTTFTVHVDYMPVRTRLLPRGTQPRRLA